MWPGTVAPNDPCALGGSLPQGHGNLGHLDVLPDWKRRTLLREGSASTQPSSPVFTKTLAALTEGGPCHLRMALSWKRPSPARLEQPAQSAGAPPPRPGTSGQPVQQCPLWEPLGHMTMTGDNSGCHNWGVMLALMDRCQGHCSAPCRPLERRMSHH